MKLMSIAIDGPSGSGKSTVAKMLAKELNFMYVDTGAMYRAITLKALNLNINLENESEYEFIKTTKMEKRGTNFFLDGVDVTDEIRSEAVVKNVSLVSSLGYVREQLVEAQREIARHESVVMDGRDIGTNVLTGADLKIYMIADPKERAKRRYLEQIQKGITMSEEEVYKDILRRDDYDSHRKLNPLRKADDAIELDNTNLSIEETFEKILNLFKELKHE